MTTLHLTSSNMAKKRLIDVSQDLIAAAAAGLGIEGTPPPGREVMDLAVNRYLDKVVLFLKRAGLTAQPTGRRRPRAISDGTWARLEKEAALSHKVTADPGRDRPVVEGGKVALTQAELLRACLVLASRRGARGSDSNGERNNELGPSLSLGQE
jgi:hypothetical protein